MTKALQDVYGVEVIARLGHDRDEPARLALHAEAGVRQELDGEARLDVQAKQGHPPFGVEMKITDDTGKATALGRQDLRPPQGARAGRGAGLLQGRARDPCSTTTACSTPAMSRTMDPYGYMQVTDRAKDVIKSGGEWISSIDLENLAVGHPKVAEAAVIGVAHPKWDERPLLVIVLKTGEQQRPRTTSWASCRARSRSGGCPTTWCSSRRSRTPRPGRLKTALREQFKDYRLPGCAGVGNNPPHFNVQAVLRGTPVSSSGVRLRDFLREKLAAIKRFALYISRNARHLT